MSGRSRAEVSAARWRTVWRRHENGIPIRAIARDLGVAQKTVQYYLAKGRPDGLSDGLRRRANPVDRPHRPSPLTDAEAESIITDTLRAATPPARPARPRGNVIPLRRTS